MEFVLWEKKEHGIHALEFRLCTLASFDTPGEREGRQVYLSHHWRIKVSQVFCMR